jgi:hypothetical protein
MCFALSLLKEVPHRAYSVVEDVEYGIRLGERGYRVHYTDEAHVYGEMVTTAAAANTQRRRWEEGRKALVKANAFRLLRDGIRLRDKVRFDLALDLLVPPLSTIAIGVTAGMVVGAILVPAAGAPGIAAAAFGLGLSSVAAYVLRGWSLSGTGLRGLVDLGLAPVYVGWKIALRFRKPPRATSEWVRTKREASEAPPP